MKTLLFLLLFLPFIVKAQSKDTSFNFFYDECPSGITTGDSSIVIGFNPIRLLTTLEAKIIDTVKVVMLVSDTSTVKGTPGSIAIGGNNTPPEFSYYQDLRPYMAYGYQTSKGELLDAYKRKLGKNIVMWIAYKIK